MGKDSPETPDPYETAQAQGQANVDAARTTAALNRFNQVTPFGRMTWEQAGPGSDQWTSTVSLDPQVERLLRASLSGSEGLQSGINSLIGQANASTANPITAREIPVGGTSETRQRVADALYGQYRSRLDPQYSTMQDQLESKLANQGIGLGSQAWSRAQDDLGRQRTDAYQTAINSSVTGAGAEEQRQQQMAIAGSQADLQNKIALQNQILNALASLRTGTQASMPQFTGQNTGASVAPAPVAQSIYNSAQMDQSGNSASNGLFGGLTSLGSAALMSPTGTFTGNNGIFSGLAKLWPF